MGDYKKRVDRHGLVNFHPYEAPIYGLPLPIGRSIHGYSKYVRIVKDHARNNSYTVIDDVGEQQFTVWKDEITIVPDCYLSEILLKKLYKR